ncbi:MAG: hypothetical protein HC811_11065 [Flammeovirgaceae bacterium]|nr:hypothetical protein [Flammeovirgaceae bacterium]
MFPLAIFPLPGELVPLHIFEPRYKQLIDEVEKTDIAFGIFFNHVMNKEKLGSLVKLESVLKRYPGGESDIVVRCIDLFTMSTLFRNYKDRIYPGGDVNYWKMDQTVPVAENLVEPFKEYLRLMNISKMPVNTTLFNIANELNLDVQDKLKFVMLDDQKKNKLLMSRIKYQSHLLSEADRLKDKFHLN